MNYYKENAKDFIKNTLNIDMSDFYARFLQHLNEKASILDIGCGSGRDLKYFKKMGFDALGIEPCSELVEFSSNHSSCDVIEVDIQNFNPGRTFDGVWACASLLHLNNTELHSAFDKIRNLSHEKTITYCSFKYGDFQGIRSSRFFNDMTLNSLIPFISGFELIENWVTKDLRPDRYEKWLNVILKVKD